MRSRSRPRAGYELREAIEWYRERDVRAARKFGAAYREALSLARRFPFSGESCGGDARQLRIAGFPYRIVYVVLDGWVTVVAVAHDSRAPGYWLKRSR